jgi:hypothetical protein
MSNAIANVVANEVEVDLRFVDVSYPSLCVPRVFYHISDKTIYRVFEDLNFGQIKRIDIIPRKNEKGDPYKRVFIHYNRWYCNEYADTARIKLITGKEIKVVYSNPWYWKVSANKHEERQLDKEEQRREEYKVRLEEERRREEERRIKEQERRKKQEEFRQIEEERKIDIKMRKDEERIMKEQRRQAEKRYNNSDAQMRLEDPDIPEMELFKIDYGNVEIPKKKKLVVKAV